MGMMARQEFATLQNTASKLERGADGGSGGSGRAGYGSAASEDAALVRQFRKMGEICDRLNVVHNDRQRAEKLLAESRKAGLANGGKKLDAVILACIYTSCRLSSNARSLKEVVAAVPGVEKKEVAKSYKEMRRVLQIHQDDVGVMGADSIVRRFCKSAGIVQEGTISLAVSLSKDLMKISSTQREPETVATACIFIGTGRRPARPARPTTARLTPGARTRPAALQRTAPPPRTSASGSSTSARPPAWRSRRRKRTSASSRAASTRSSRTSPRPNS